MNPNIELHIDQLVLRGFSRNDAHYIGQSMKAELHRLITDRGLPSTFHTDLHQGRINTKPLQLKQTSSPEHTGRQIANTIYGGLSINTNNS